MSRSSLRLAILAALVSLLGCSATHSTRRRLYVLDAKTSKDRPGNYLGLPLRSGQLVLTEAPGPYSFLFSIGAVRYTDFTHAGILVMEGGKPFVYDMTGEYKPGFDDSPTDGIEGFCRRLPLMEYVQPSYYSEIFDLPVGVDAKKVVDWVLARYREQPEFDPYFKWSEHKALFCTEFVQLALMAGGAPEPKLERVRQNPSLQRLLAWFKVEQTWNLPAGTFADPKRYVAALGQLPTRTAAYCYFEAKREIHRRFRDDQLLGNIFEMDGWSDIALRPEIARFLNRAVNLFPMKRKMAPRNEIQAKVRTLAEEMFGVSKPDKASQQPRRAS